MWERGEIYSHILCLITTFSEVLYQNIVFHWSHVLLWKEGCSPTGPSFRKIQVHFLLFRKCLNNFKKFDFLTSVFGKTFPGKMNKAATKYLTMNHSFVCPTLFETKTCKAFTGIYTQKPKHCKNTILCESRKTVFQDYLNIFQHFQKCSNILPTHEGHHTDREVTIRCGDYQNPSTM